MSARQPRQFHSEPAVRKQVPLLAGVTGPSGGGKTYSALRLATGMARIYKGGIIGIDTENKRLLHYADQFKFEWQPFPPPHGPLDYIDAIAAAIKKMPKAVVIVDSGSQEHIGDGGVLEQHAEVVDAKGMNFSQIAWKKPKAERRKLLNFVIQNVEATIWCFKAKENYDFTNKSKVENLGYMPLAGEEIIFELTCNALLLEGAMGVPTWLPTERGAKKMTKLPEQFRKLLLDHQGPLDERIGEEMAKWAMGGAVDLQTSGRAVSPPPPPTEPTSKGLSETEARLALRACKTMDQLADVWRTKLTNDQREVLLSVKDQVKEDIQLKLDIAKGEGDGTAA